jgi:hypothetical protein
MSMHFQGNPSKIFKMFFRGNETLGNEQTFFTTSSDGNFGDFGNFFNRGNQVLLNSSLIREGIEKKNKCFSFVYIYFFFCIMLSFFLYIIIIFI